MYKYYIFMDGQLLTESYEMEYETEEEALEEGKQEIRDRIDDWKSEGCYDGETMEDFVIEIKEV